MLQVNRAHESKGRFGKDRWQTVTRGEGVKNWDFYGDILFEWPLKAPSQLIQAASSIIGNTVTYLYLSAAIATKNQDVVRRKRWYKLIAK